MTTAAIWTLAEEGRITGIIAAISITNLYYIIRKLRDHRSAMKALVLLRDAFSIAPCVQQVIVQAIDSGTKDFENAVQYFSAVHAGADSLVTRDPGHFPRRRLAVVSPGEFLAGLRDKD